MNWEVLFKMDNTVKDVQRGHCSFNKQRNLLIDKWTTLIGNNVAVPLFAP